MYLGVADGLTEQLEMRHSQLLCFIQGCKASHCPSVLKSEEGSAVLISVALTDDSLGSPLNPVQQRQV